MNSADPGHLLMTAVGAGWQPRPNLSLGDVRFFGESARHGYRSWAAAGALPTRHLDRSVADGDP